MRGGSRARVPIRPTHFDEPRNNGTTGGVYAVGDRPGTGHVRGYRAMQSARPRDFGMLFLVVAMFLVLLVVSASLGTSAAI